MSTLNRITPEERMRRRAAIRELAERQARVIAQGLLNRQMTEVCAEATHDGCRWADCLCRCHDSSSPQYPDRCKTCGQDVQYLTGTMMPQSMWVHVGHSDHPAQPVKKAIL